MLASQLNINICGRERTRLGQTMRMPMSNNYMTLSLSVVFSLVAATTLRCLETIIGGFYPELPRFAFVRHILRFVTSPLHYSADVPSAPGPPSRTSSFRKVD